MKSKIPVILFIAAAVIHLAALLAGFQTIGAVSKPMLMITLGLYYVLNVNEERSGLVIGAIVFSLAGDVILMQADLFIGGLICFLVAHVLYIFAYRQHRDELSPEGVHGIQRARLAFPIVLAGTGLVVILYPSLGDLRFAVMAYAVIITVMVLQALFRLGRTSNKSFWMVFGGAALFMISDSILAINKFMMPVDMAGFWIMLTYIAGQGFIIRGLLAHVSPEVRRWQVR